MVARKLSFERTRARESAKKEKSPQSSVAHCFTQRHLKVRYVRALWYTRQYVALSVACALSRNTLDLRLAIPYSPSHSLRSTDHQRDIRRMKYLSSKAVAVGAVALAAGDLGVSAGDGSSFLETFTATSWEESWSYSSAEKYTGKFAVESMVEGTDDTGLKVGSLDDDADEFDP